MLRLGKRFSHFFRVSLIPFFRVSLILVDPRWSSFIAANPARCEYRYKKLRVQLRSDPEKLFRTEIALQRIRRSRRAL